MVPHIHAELSVTRIPIMDLSIIIVNWNSKEYLRKCIASIMGAASGINFEIVVIDSGSFDGSGEMLAKEYPAVIFIQSEENLGFARCNNFAASHSNGHVLLFLNPDTEIIGPALRALLEVMHSLPDAGAAGARLLNSDGTLQTSSVQPFPTILNMLVDANLLRRVFPNARLWGMTPKLAAADTPQRVDGISGACLMTHRLIFEQVGGFSEDYFMYYEDMDYCLKVYKAGWNNYFVPNAAVTHHGGKSSGEGRLSTVRMAESGWKFFLRQRGPHYARLFRVGLAAKALSRFFLLAVYMLIQPVSRQGRARMAFEKWACVLRWCLRLKY